MSPRSKRANKFVTLNPSSHPDEVSFRTFDNRDRSYDVTDRIENASKSQTKLKTLNPDIMHHLRKTQNNIKHINRYSG